MILKLEADNGEEIEACIEKGIDIADRLKISCEFMFNGIFVWVYPGDSVGRVYKSYMDRFKFNNGKRKEMGR